MSRPDPFREIRLVSLRSLRGANFWSRDPVTRLDVEVGAYDEISSADVPGLTEALHAALPGLMEHRCSIGERGGFLERLRRGTYAPHIMEHVALELQGMIGHDVAYGRARGGDRAGEYTVVFEHVHGEVGLRAAALALDVVQQAFAGTLRPVEPAVRELASLRDSPDYPALRQHVLCGITGGGARARSAVRDEMLRRGSSRDGPLVDVAPAYLLNAGLPYSRSEVAVILDADLHDVPDRYREADRAQRLVSVVADGVPRDRVVVVPAREREVQELVRDARCRVAIFSAEESVSREDARGAWAVGTVRDGRIVLERSGAVEDGGEARPEVPSGPQVAAALAMLGIADAQRVPAG